jgi:hypothetical protein
MPTLFPFIPQKPSLGPLATPSSIQTPTPTSTPKMPFIPPSWLEGGGGGSPAPQLPPPGGASPVPQPTSMTPLGPDQGPPQPLSPAPLTPPLAPSPLGAVLPSSGDNQTLVVVAVVGVLILGLFLVTGRLR